MDDETAGSGNQNAVSSHVDQRTRREKILALASHPRTEPAVAEAARRALDALPAPKTLGRDDILGAPDRRASVGSRSVWSPFLGAYVVVDADDPLFASLFVDVQTWAAGLDDLEDD